MICSMLQASGQAADSFNYLSKKDGLSQVSVFAIAQDSAGFMWFGTRNGLNRFDGYQFKIYRKDTTNYSLVSDDMRCLYVDPLSHDMWVGSNLGLGKYRVSTDNFTNYFSSTSDSTTISGNVIRQIFRDSKGRLWVGTSMGLSLYKEELDNFTNFNLKDAGQENSPRKDVRVILEDASGQIWLGTSDGLYQLRENAGQPFSFTRMDGKGNLQLNDTHIRSLVETPQGNLWIGTDEGGLHLWKIKADEISVYQSDKNNPSALSHNNIRSMCLDEKENLWVGTFNGLSLLKKGENAFQIFHKDEGGTSSLSDNSIHSVFLDRRGSLWAGTYYGGVNHLDDNYNRFTNFTHNPFKNSLSADVVSSFAEDENGNLWIGTEGGGLNFLDTKTQQFTSYQYRADDKNSIGGNNIKQLLLDGDQLWVGIFQGGLNLLDLRTKKFQQFKSDAQKSNSISTNNVYGLRKRGNKLWILTYGKGLDILDLEKNQFYNYPENSNNSNSICSNLTRVFLETEQGQLWIGTEKGLNKVTVDAEGFPEKFETYFPKEKIYSLQRSSNQNIWVGTYTNGLYSFNPKTGASENYTTADGLSGNSIFGILQVNEKQLWLSTNNGLSKFDLEKKSFTNYDYSNGLVNLEHNFNAYYQTRAGNLLFGGINGFTKFNPKNISPNEFIPPVVFTQLRKNNQVVDVQNFENYLQKDINETESIAFDYNDANFSISFAALDYFSPENNRYAYKLEGLDKDWNYSVGKTEISYAIQREGNYTFRLRGANSDGVWNPQERQLTVVVRPPVYRTWWAYLIYIIAVSMAIFGLIRFIRLRHKLQLQQIAKQKQEELHEMKLRFYTNLTHEFRTPLTLILGPLKELIAKEKQASEETQQLSMIERNAQRLLNLVNQLMTFRKLATDHEPMKIAELNLVLFLEEIFLPFRELARLRNIDYQFQNSSTEIEAWFDEGKLEKVFFNLLSNAFKFTPDGGKISLEVLEEKEFIEIRVTDNGVGVNPELQQQIFKRFYEKSNTQISSIKGSGIGLAISKQMVELHEGEIFVKSPTLDAEGGATFIVRIPKGRAHFNTEKIVEDFSLEKKVSLQLSPTFPPPTPALENLPISDLEKMKKLPLLLIVEDNPEIMQYVQRVFTGTYQFVTAENGEEGLEQVKKHAPELIISDVMMPKMDGITFCGKLKSDIETSHIPIILLTARTTSIFKIEGLKIGADDYVTKPFDPEELKLRVRNIIQSRQEIRNKFARVLTFDPKEINVTSADEKILESAMEIVEKNIGNYDFNVNQFATDLAVSRPLLFTKLKSLTGQTPNNFIKTIRLKRAAQLLKTKKLNVSEVAYQVGFKDPKYFRKCFQEQFEVTPSKYDQN